MASTALHAACPRARATSSAPARRCPSSRSKQKRCARLHRAWVTLLLALTALALVRVTLTARMAESAIRAAELRRTIESQRAATQLLEADRSSLTTPSRIEAIASASMRMTLPSEVRYLELPSGGVRDAGAGDDRGYAAAHEGGPRGLGGLFSAAMDVAAGGTQVLLVGDVGLTPVR